MRPLTVGNWIRFMHGGVLVIDEVAYMLPRARWDSTLEAMTLAHGRVSIECIVEVRPR